MFTPLVWSPSRCLFRRAGPGVGVGLFATAMRVVSPVRPLYTTVSPAQALRRKPRRSHTMPRGGVRPAGYNLCGESLDRLVLPIPLRAVLMYAPSVSPVFKYIRVRTGQLLNIRMYKRRKADTLIRSRRSPRGLSVFEPVLVLLAVGHGGIFEGLGLCVQLLISDAFGLSQMGRLRDGLAQAGQAQVSSLLRSASLGWPGAGRPLSGWHK